VIATLFQYLLLMLQGYYSSRLNHQYAELWTKNLFSAYFRAGWPFFVNSKAGNLNNLLISETTRAGGAFATLSDLLMIFWIATFYLILSFALCWECTLLFLVGSLAVGTVTLKLIKSNYDVGSQISEANEDMISLANESISNAKYIKSSALEEFTINRFRDTVRKLRQLYFWGSFFPKIMRSIIELSSIILLCNRIR